MKHEDGAVVRNGTDMCKLAYLLTYLLLSLPESQTAEAPVKHIAEHDHQLQRADHSSERGTKIKHSHGALARATHPTLSSSQKALSLPPSLSLSG